MKKPTPTTKLPEHAFTLYDQFAHGRINRREFMSGLTTLAVGGLTASSIMSALMPDYALAEQVSFNDPDIKATYQNFTSPKGHGQCRGYRVEPVNLTQSAPIVLVIHENRGLNPYIKDVARRLAKAGFIAFAPDGLFPVGGYPGNDEQGKAMQRAMNGEKLQQDFFAAAAMLKGDSKGYGKVGAVGFCYGGGMVNKLVSEQPDSIDAGVPFYGAAPDVTKVINIQAPLLIHMGELDEWVNAMWPDYEKALKDNNKSYQAYIYPKARHGFHNDSTPRFDKQHAELAWQRTLAFFNQHLIPTA